jgi:hypothetical protein
MGPPHSHQSHRSHRFYGRIALALLLVVTASPVHAELSAVVHGRYGWCAPITPAIANVLEWIGAEPEFEGTDVSTIVPAGEGRIFGLSRQGTQSLVVHVRRGLASQPIATLPAGVTAISLAVGRDRIFVLTHRPPGSTSAIHVFDRAGKPLATHEIDPAYGLDLAADQCTLYLDRGAGVLGQFDACTGTAGGTIPINDYLNSFRILPDGGFLTAAGSALHRYTASGVLVRTYETSLFDIRAMGLARKGDAAWVVDGDICDGGSILLVDLVTGEALEDDHTEIEAPTSIVAAHPWTAALGHLAGEDIPALAPAALLALAALLAVAAAAKLR